MPIAQAAQSLPASQAAEPPVPPRPVPAGSVLLHVGPHKTGTTAVQGALWAARQELARQGVRVAGGSRNPASAVRAATGRASAYTDDEATPGQWRWRLIVAAVRRARDARVVLSSEFFAWAVDDAPSRVADDLGADRVQVVVTLRSLARVVPSMWQQNVQSGTTATIDEWIRTILEQQSGSKRNGFWTLQRHDELVQRWVEAVGRDRVRAVVVDERDHGVVLRAFEGLLGLPAATLALVEDSANRSLTASEAEAVRAFNVAFQTRKLPRGLHARLMRFGAAQLMKRRVPALDEARVALPDWARDPIDAIQREIVDGIREAGIEVIGNLDSLLDDPGVRRSTRAAIPQDASLIPADVAAAMAMGIIEASGEARRSQSRRGRVQVAEPVPTLDVPTYQLGAVVALRGLRGMAKTIDRATRGLRDRDRDR